MDPTGKQVVIVTLPGGEQRIVTHRFTDGGPLLDRPTAEQLADDVNANLGAVAQVADVSILRRQVDGLCYPDSTRETGECPDITLLFTVRYRLWRLESAQDVSEHLIGVLAGQTSVQHADVVVTSPGTGLSEVCGDLAAVLQDHHETASETLDIDGTFDRLETDLDALVHRAFERGAGSMLRTLSQPGVSAPPPECGPVSETSTAEQPATTHTLVDGLMSERTSAAEIANDLDVALYYALSNWLPEAQRQPAANHLTDVILAVLRGQHRADDADALASDPDQQVPEAVQTAREVTQRTEGGDRR